MVAALTGGAVTAYSLQDPSPAPGPLTFTGTSSAYPEQSFDDAVSSTLRGLDAAAFASITQTDDSESGGRELSITMNGGNADKMNGDFAPLLWQALLAEGSIMERVAGDSPTLGRQFTSVDVNASLDGGRTGPISEGGVGHPKAGQVFPAQTALASDDDIRAHLQNVVSGFGLGLTEVQVYRPLGPAIAVVASTPSVGALAGKFYSLVGQLQGDPVQYEGLYLEIDDALGNPLVRLAYSYRAPSSYLWFAPGVDTVLHLSHS